MNATVTQLPTLCAPEKLDRNALIFQVNYLQDELIMQGMELHQARSRADELYGISKRLDVLLGALADSYDAGDQAAILLQVKKLSEQRQSKKAKVH